MKQNIMWLDEAQGLPEIILGSERETAGLIDILGIEGNHYFFADKDV